MHLLNNLWWRLVRFGFRLLYNELAFTYDLVSKVVSLGAWRCWQRSALDYLPEVDAGTVLELAHGTGDIQIDMKQAGYYTVGYDLSKQMGRITRGKLRRNGLEPLLVQGRGQNLPFADRAFSAVIVTFPTPFIFEPVTLRELHRVLTADGVLVMVTNGVFTASGIITLLLEWAYRITGQRAESGQTQALPTTLIAGFEQCGFEAHFEQKACRRSLAQLVVAHKLVLPIST